MSIFIINNAYAACTGSTPTWTCTADSTSAQIQTCINSATAGDTINVGAGSGSWSTQIAITKSIYLIGAGIGSTIISTGANNQIYINLTPTNASDNIPIRVSGFTFNVGASVLFLYRNNSLIYDSTKVRLDHLRFVQSSGYTVYLSGLAHGLMDNCQSSGAVFFGLLGGFNLWNGNSAAAAYYFGTTSTFWFEDNVWNGYAMFDGNGAGRYSTRYNTHNPTVYQGYYDQHGDHGGAQSGMGAEIYGNQVNANPGGSNQYIDARGGKWLYFYNNLTNAGAENWPLLVREEQQDSTIPPAVHVYSGQTHHINNTYAWGNWRNGVAYNVGSLLEHLTCDTCGEYVPTEGIHYFKYPTGVGCGTSLPATCTPVTSGSYGGKESATGEMRGPGYWLVSAGDAGSCTNLTGYVGDINTYPTRKTISGTLYKCTATNTWTSYYTPLTYPHPLRGGATSGPRAPIGVGVGPTIPPN